MFTRLADAVGRADWLADPRFADSNVRKGYLQEINAELGRALAPGTSARWQQKLEAADVLVSPVNDYRALHNDPQMRAMSSFARIEQAPYGPLDVPHLPAAGRNVTAAPRLGEHTREVLAEAGLSAAEIAALLATDVARQLGE